MRISVDYTIMARPWWIANYAGLITPESVGEEIVRWRTVIERAQADPEPSTVELLEAYEGAHRLVYLKELLIGEGILRPTETATHHDESGAGDAATKDSSPPEDPLEYVEQLLNGVILLGDPSKAKLTRKVRNIDGVVRRCFPTIFFPPFNLTRFTPDFICALHAEAMEGLLDNAGQYRVRLLLTITHWKKSQKLPMFNRRPMGSPILNIFQSNLLQWFSN